MHERVEKGMNAGPHALGRRFWALKRNRALLERVNATGEIFISHAVL